PVPAACGASSRSCAGFCSPDREGIRGSVFGVRAGKESCPFRIPKPNPRLPRGIQMTTDELKAELEREGLDRNQRIQVEIAYHTARLADACRIIAERLKSISLTQEAIGAVET